MTVSRALRDPDRVSKKSLEHIRSVIERLGYAPDPAAQALAAGRTNVIGVIVPSVTNNVPADVMRGLIISGIDQSDETRSLRRQAACRVVQIMETGDRTVRKWETGRSACSPMRWKTANRTNRLWISASGSWRARAPRNRRPERELCSNGPPCPRDRRPHAGSKDLISFSKIASAAPIAWSML